jgi:hypothetical protein
LQPGRLGLVFGDSFAAAETRPRRFHSSELPPAQLMSGRTNFVVSKNLAAGLALIAVAVDMINNLTVNGRTSVDMQ